MIYFDNAATGGFKVHAAISAAENVIKYLSANPGRSGHRLSVTGAKIVAECRETLAKLFDADPARVIFTKNCTEALNVALFGTAIKGKVVTTVAEHNSVLRPLSALQKRGVITTEILPLNNLAERVLSAASGATAIVTAAVTNVTGETLPLSAIGEIAKSRDIPFIVDGAQGGGHIPLSVRKQNITCLALAGHKGLGGIMGSGVLILNDGVSVDPFLFGGTGTETFLTDMPENLPERLEAGTLNLPAIASLLEGVRYTAGNFSHFAKTLTDYTQRLADGLKELPAVKVYSAPNPAGIVSFKIDGVDSITAAEILSDEYDVAVRGGFHCAPLMHKALKTENEGLVRASLAVGNSAAEIDFFIKAVKKIAAKSF